MKNELNTNNSNKLFIGVSILFCTFILIVGGTIAYFTQSDTKNMDSLVTANINDTLEYKDNTTYMRQELIPAKESVAKQAYTIEGNNKCLDMNGYSACSVYEFNIKNTANVSQELIIDLIPTVNTFANLHFILYEIDEDGNSNELISSKKIDMLTEEIIQNNNIPIYNLKKELVLNSNKDKTYQVVFFINDTGIDQTKEDAGKQFGGTIKISSVATGQYITKSFGTNCWTTELLPDNTYKLKAFHGIDNTLDNINLDTREITFGENYGTINESCTGYINDDDEDGFYSVYIPSNVGGQQISTLGNELFSVAIMDGAGNPQDIRGNYGKINDIQIEEGITTIEDGCVADCEGTQSSAFYAIGIDLITFAPFENFSLNVNLPSTLKEIGNSAFSTLMDSITIPGSVIRIGSSAFTALKSITFEEATNDDIEMVIEEDAFSGSMLTELILPKKTKIIGEYAFRNNLNLTYVYIPEKVSEIGNYAFTVDSGYTSSLKEIEFAERIDNSSEMIIGNWAFNNNAIEEVFIPRYVTSIGDYVFSGSKNLTTLTFEEGSKLTSIGEDAFASCALDYQNEDSPLYLPNNEFTTMGNYAFNNNPNLKYIYYEGDTTGFGSSWNGNATLLPRRN